MKRFGRLATLLRLPWLPVWLAPVILIAPTLLAGKAVFWGTPFLQFVPWRAYAWEAIRSGVIPLWNPLSGMGAPLIANYQSALFYPPNWLLLAFQAAGGVTLQAWGQCLVILFHWIWAGAGMVLLTRNLGFRPLGQAVSGLAFGLSAYLVTRSGFLSINAAAAWMPWVVLGANQIAGPDREGADRPTDAGFRGILPLGLALGFQMLSGHAQTTWYTLVFAGLWVLFWSVWYNGWRGLPAVSAKFALASLIAIGLAAVQLLPTAEYLLQSQRSSAVDFDYAVNFSFWPWHLITLLAPDFFGSPVRGDYWFNAWFWEDAVYIGLLPFVVGLLGVVNAFIKKNPVVGMGVPRFVRPLTGFLGFSIICAFAMALGRYTPIFPFFYRNIPTFNMFQAPARWTIWAVFAFCLLAGIGVDRWTRPMRRGLYWTRLATAGAGAVMLGAGIGWIVLGDVQPTFIRALAAAGFWAVGTGILALLAPRPDATDRAPIWKWGVVALVSLDLLAANWGMNPGITQEFYRTTAETGTDVRELAGGHRVFLDPDAEAGLKFGQFLNAKSFHPAEDWSHFGAYLLPDTNLMEDVASANNFDPLVPGRYAAWIEKLGQLDPAGRSEMLRLMDVAVVEKADPLDPAGVRFEQIDGAARLRWTGCAGYALNEDQAWNLLIPSNQTQNSPKTGYPMVILENASPGSNSQCDQTGVAQIQVIGENSNRTEIQITTDRPGWLVQSDVWYPGWVARVDGRDTPVLRADVLFRAVAIPAGTHQVVIQYQPLSFYMGIIGTSITLLSLTLALWISRRRSIVRANRRAEEALTG